MPIVDFPTLMNWIIAGCIGFVFGAGSAYITYQFERRRDDLKWQRELEKLRIEFKLEAIQRRQEHAGERIEETSDRIKAELTQGLDDPAKAIRSLSALQSLVGDSWRGARLYQDPLYSMLESIKSHRRRLSGIAVFVGVGLGVSVTMIAYWFLAGWLVSVSPLG